MEYSLKGRPCKGEHFPCITKGKEEHQGPEYTREHWSCSALDFGHTESAALCNLSLPETKSVTCSTFLVLYSTSVSLCALYFHRTVSWKSRVTPCSLATWVASASVLPRKKSRLDERTMDFFCSRSAVLRPSVHMLPGIGWCGAGLPPFSTTCWWLTHRATITGFSVVARWNSPGGWGGPSVLLPCNCRVQSPRTMDKIIPRLVTDPPCFARDIEIQSQAPGKHTVVKVFNQVKNRQGQVTGEGQWWRGRVPRGREGRYQEGGTKREGTKRGYQEGVPRGREGTKREGGYQEGVPRGGTKREGVPRGRGYQEGGGTKREGVPRGRGYQEGGVPRGGRVPRGGYQEGGTKREGTKRGVPRRREGTKREGTKREGGYQEGIYPEGGRVPRGRVPRGNIPRGRKGTKREGGYQEGGRVPRGRIPRRMEATKREDTKREGGYQEGGKVPSGREGTKREAGYQEGGRVPRGRVPRGRAATKREDTKREGGYQEGGRLPRGRQGTKREGGYQEGGKVPRGRLPRGRQGTKREATKREAGYQEGGYQEGGRVPRGREATKREAGYQEGVRLPRGRLPRGRLPRGSLPATLQSYSCCPGHCHWLHTHSAAWPSSVCPWRFFSVPMFPCILAEGGWVHTAWVSCTVC